MISYYVRFVQWRIDEDSGLGDLYRYPEMCVVVEAPSGTRRRVIKSYIECIFPGASVLSIDTPIKIQYEE